MKQSIFGLIPLSLLLFSLDASAEPVAPDAAKEGKPAPKYISEAPLPKGWPQPGPFNQVSSKTYPAYRAAVTQSNSSSFAFWRLFNHIKRQNIPMTSPVEMNMGTKGDGKVDGEAKEGEQKLRMSSMSFLYQDQNVGKKGDDGAKVTVKDFPSVKTLSYTWQGTDSKANIEIARKAIMAELKKRQLKHSTIRKLGYNGPGVPRDKKTWELQAILEKGKGE